MLFKVRYSKGEIWIERITAPQIGSEILFGETLVMVDRVIDIHEKHETVVITSEKIKDLDL